MLKGVNLILNQDDVNKLHHNQRFMLYKHVELTKDSNGDHLHNHPLVIIESVGIDNTVIRLSLDEDNLRVIKEIINSFEERL